MSEKKKGIFLIHGFMESSIKSYKFLLNRLNNEKNIGYLSVDLQGHGDNEDINDFDHRLCIKKVSKQYIKFKNEYDEVIIVGFSMGGVIASYLASQYKCDKLILFSPAFKYIQNTSVGSDLFTILGRMQLNKVRRIIDKRYKEKDVLELIKKRFRNENTYLLKVFSDSKNKLTIKPFKEFMLLVEKLKRNIRIKDIPVRIYMGENDELVPLSSAVEIFKKINSKQKRLIVLPNIYHSILTSSIHDEVIDETLEFIR